MKANNYTLGFDAHSGSTFHAGDVETQDTEEEIPVPVVQLYRCMEMNHNRFGYLMNETELVMFRRRVDGDRMCLDVSPPVFIHYSEGNLNALMVLWYFHVKYAVFNDEPGYYMPLSHEASRSLTIGTAQ